MSLLAGILVGLILSAPLGPLGFLGALQAAQGYFSRAVFLALGVCVADVIMAAVALLFSRYLQESIVLYSGWLFGIKSTLVVVLMLMATFMWKNAEKIPQKPDIAANFTTGLCLSLMHPGNVFAFLGAFTLLHAHGLLIKGTLLEYVLLLGIFLGTFAMWCVLLMAAHRYGKKLSGGHFSRIRKIIALIFCAVCVGLIVDILWR